MSYMSVTVFVYLKQQPELNIGSLGNALGVSGMEKALTRVKLMAGAHNYTKWPPSEVPP